MLRQKGKSQKRNRKVLRPKSTKPCNLKPSNTPETDSPSTPWPLFTDDFVKVSQRARRAATDREIGPGDGGSWHFEGDRLVATRSFISGANQLTISFDASFQTCSADLVIGSESGKPRVWKALNGETLTAAGNAEVSGVSCSIQEGNAFAN
jgi:hypothetical protein